MYPLEGKNCGSINLVRIGRLSSIHPQVVPFTLDVLCKTELAKFSAGDMTKEETVKVDLQNVRAKIDQLEKKSYALQCAGPSQQNQVWMFLFFLFIDKKTHSNRLDTWWARIAMFHVSQMANAWNVRLCFPYRKYTDLWNISICRPTRWLVFLVYLIKTYNSFQRHSSSII